MHGITSSSRCYYFTSLPFLAADRDARAPASVSGSRGYTSAGTSANAQAHEFHVFLLSYTCQQVFSEQRIFCLQVLLPGLCGSINN